MYALDSLKTLFVNCQERESGLSVLVTLTWTGDFSGFSVPGARIVESDGEEWVLEIALSEGGGGG